MLFRKKATPIATQPSHMIVGLGNPGPEYAGTRHNVGFDVVEAVARDAGRKIETRKHKAVFGLAEIDGIPLLLVRPLTFMNLSGQAVAALAREHRIPPDKILVVAGVFASNRKEAQAGTTGIAPSSRASERPSTPASESASGREVTRPSNTCSVDSNQRSGKRSMKRSPSRSKRVDAG